ncbi:FAD-binding oxidoreductase [Oerskovia sp. Sa1BUA8]|uniref:FAD-binding oxidoreductase n=1 Tax=Oerskovia douganii TaxID=2762210 RepID=A0A9D5UF57_9CELL|nr:FAD-binding oxidoreductase [Oerskovia douganii]MBE7699782.1 FAD-binding oxidoreductase [Oerskovia douganii]
MTAHETTQDVVLAALGQSVTGRVLAGTDPDARLSGMNVAVEHHPDYVVHATSPEDVQATVRTAKLFGLPVTVFSTGHGFARGIDGGIALSTAGLTGVEVDEPARTARIAAGTRWRDVLDVVTPLGLAAVTGSSPDVGAVGFLLGGGIGPLAREVGFGSSYLVEADVVAGDGELIHVDEAHHPEVLRALRGGKWGLGVVTSVTVRLLNLETVTGGNFFALGDDAATLFRTYADWVATAPSDITTSVALLRLPPLELVPEPLRGQYVANVRVASTRPLSEVLRAIAPLRTTVPIVMDSIAEIPYAQIGGVHADPTDPMPFLDGSTLLHTFEPRTADAVLEFAGPQTQTPLMMTEIRHLGGALADGTHGPDSVTGRDAAFALFTIGLPVPELFAEAVPAAINGLLEAARPWSLGRTQANFAGAISEAAPFDLWSPSDQAHLATVRRELDPDGRFALPA